MIVVTEVTTTSRRGARMLTRCEYCRGEITRSPISVVSMEAGDSYVAAQFCSERCALQAALSYARGEE
jgi:hypothetical protein